MLSSGRIRKLNPQVLSELRSQTIFNSLASVVQELLRNSLDAQAKVVEIRLDLDSLAVQVADNGVGIPADDMLMVGERYHTSKLKQIKDLPFISTYGYRGEALYALGLVSRLSIVSKSDSGDVTFVRMISYNSNTEVYDYQNYTNDGFFRVEPIKKNGTIVTATGLYCNLPVRRQQIRAVSQFKIIDEIRHIVFQSLVKFPDVSIKVLRLDHDSLNPDILINYSPSNTRKTDNFACIFRNIYGKSVLPKFHTLEAEQRGLQLTGFVGTDPVSSKRFQYIFFNGSLQGYETTRIAVNQTFKESRFGDIPESVSYRTGESPSKKRSRLLWVWPVFLVCIESVKKGATIEADEITKFVVKVFKQFLVSQGFQVDSGPSVFGSPRISLSPSKRRKTSPSGDEEPRVKKSDQLDSTFLNVAESGLTSGNYRIVRQLDSKFILVSSSNNLGGKVLLVIDQHACDERIKVEALFKDFIFLVLDAHTNLLLRVVEPVTFAVSSVEVQLFEEYAENLNKFGIRFIIEGLTIVVTHMPQIILEKSDIDADILRRWLLLHVNDLKEESKSAIVDTYSINDWFPFVRHLPTFLIDIINSKACHSSVVFGEVLEYSEMEKMVRQLLHCRLPFQCAHGRPSIVPLVNIQ